MKTEFARWLLTATAGDQYRYHQGPHTAGCRQGLLDAVRTAYNRGDVTLAQRRTDHGFDYLAIRLAVPGKVLCPFKIGEAQ